MTCILNDQIDPMTMQRCCPRYTIVDDSLAVECQPLVLQLDAHARLW